MFQILEVSPHLFDAPCIFYQAIKTSMRDCSELSAKVLSCLGALCEWQYSVPEGGTAPLGNEQSTAKHLSVKDLHSLLVTHARYDNLMMKAATDAQLKLKGELES